MSLFKRRARPSDDELGVLLLQGQDMIERTGRAHAREWGLGGAERWELDQASGTLRWSFPDLVAEAPAQILGSYSPAAGSWMWAWANDSLLPQLRSVSDAVRVWGEGRGHAMLTSPRLDLTPEQAADLSALAVRLTGATGFYRAAAGRSELHLTFGPVELIAPDGNRRTFSIDLG